MSLSIEDRQKLNEMFSDNNFSDTDLFETFEPINDSFHEEVDLSAFLKDASPNQSTMRKSVSAEEILAELTGVNRVEAPSTVKEWLDEAVSTYSGLFQALT